MQAFVPKNRRPKFEVQLKVVDLNNVPLVSATEHRDRSAKCIIKDHKVVYDYEKTVPVRLVIDKNSKLQELWIEFEVVQEYAMAGKVERNVLGSLKLNLAEYVQAGDNEGGDGITRRYLMQESKINSTLKISIYMKQIDGDKNYTAPVLKSAPVFGGIAGVVTNEQVETTETGDYASLSSKSRELGELQDVYRRALAASWATRTGEPQADECIEDIFAGGDGWGDYERPHLAPAARKDPLSSDASSFIDSERRSASRMGHRPTKSLESGFKDDTGMSMGHDPKYHHGHHLASDPPFTANEEVDEIEYREDLRSWGLPRVRL